MSEPPVSARVSSRAETTARFAGTWLALLVAIGVSALASDAADVVRVATFNVRNYLATDRRVDDRFRPNYPKPEQEKAAVRSAIHAVQPDVLALQEIGPAPYLEELRRDLIAEGLEYPHSQLLEAADAERHVAVLSRLPFARMRLHRDIQFAYFGETERVKRGLLEVTFASAAVGEWTLFVVHLKSRLTDRTDDPKSAERRLCEARAVRDVILERFPQPADARFLLVGDCNDTTGSKTLTALQERGSVRLGQLVPAADSRGETWTQRYLAEDLFSRSDYVLASPGLFPAIVNGSGHVHDGPTVLDGSDHRMVWVELQLRATQE